MKYYYFPSSYFNKGSKRRRRRGGTVRGYGYIVGGSLEEGIEEAKPVDPETLSKEEKKVAKEAEEKKKEPVEIDAGNWKYWNNVKKVAGETWSGTKNVLDYLAELIGKLRLNPYDIARTYTYIKYPPGAFERVTTNALGMTPYLATIMLSLMKAKGSGYSKKKRRKNWLKKGSPEARAYMARLRSMKRN